MKFWIKLYAEMLRDRKVAELPDRLWRRFVEMILFAGEKDENGDLPPLEDMAWTLRIEASELEGELKELCDKGLLEFVASGYYIPRFDERQSAMDRASYMRKYRKTKSKQAYNEIISAQEGDGEEPRVTPDQLIFEITDFVSFPPSQISYYSTIQDMLDTYGYWTTRRVLAKAMELWEANRSSKTGRKWNRGNFTWIEWGLTIAATGIDEFTKIAKGDKDEQAFQSKLDELVKQLQAEGELR